MLDFQRLLQLKLKTNSDIAYWYYVVPIMAIACTAVMWPVLSASNELFPYGVDTMGHLTKVEYLAERWRNMQFSDWFPQWYSGATILQYYPPLSIWAGAFIQLFTNNIMLTFKIFAWGCLLGGGLFTANLSRKLGGNVISGVSSALLFSLGHFTLMSVFYNGTLGITISTLLYPAFLSRMICLIEKKSFSNWLSSCLLMALLVLSHAMHSYLLYIAVALFCLIYALRNTPDWKSFFLTIEAACVGIALTGFWSVPGVTPWENPGVPWLPTGISEALVIPLKGFFIPGSSGDISYPAFYLTLLGIVFGYFMIRRSFLWASLFVSWLVTTSLTLGPKNIFYRLLPFKTSLAPVRFLSAADLPAALLGGFVIQGVVQFLTNIFKNTRSKNFFGLVMALTIIYFIIVSSPLVPLNSASDFNKMRFLINTVSSPGDTPFEQGRVATELPDTGCELASLPVKYGLNSIYGWNIEGTVHSHAIIERNISYDEGYHEYIVRNWYLLNVRSAILDLRFTHINLLSECLQASHWSFLDKNEESYIFTFHNPSTYLMKLHSDVIVIGRSSYYVARLFPWITEGRVSNPLEYDEEYLDLFKVIYLYDLPKLNIAELEKRIEGWLRKDKKVIIDLSATEKIPEIFDVWHFEKPVSGDITLFSTEEGTSCYDNDLIIHVKEGSGAVYRGLDKVMLATGEEKGDYAACGAKKIPEGEIYFTGLHIPRLIQPEFKEEAKILLSPLLELGNPRQEIIPESFDTFSTNWDHKGVEFEYESQETQPVIISVTYTPRWKAFIDGEAVPTYRYENLVLLILPEGRHTVSMKYGSTSAVYTGWLVTALAAGWLVWRGNTLHKRNRVKPEETE